MQRASAMCPTPTRCAGESGNEDRCVDLAPLSYTQVLLAALSPVCLLELCWQSCGKCAWHSSHRAVFLVTPLSLCLYASFHIHASPCSVPHAGT